MTEKDYRKTKLELQRVQLAKSTMEDNLADMKEEIERVLGNIKIQEQKEQELTEKLNKKEGN